MTKVRVKYYMHVNIEDHIDPLTGEMCSTTLAEDACCAFEAYGPAPQYDIPQDFFEWAFEVVTDLEQRARVHGGHNG